MILAIVRLLLGIAAFAVMIAIVLPGALVAAVFYILSAAFADPRTPSYFR